MVMDGGPVQGLSKGTGRRVWQWLSGTGPTAGLLGRWPHGESAGDSTRFDPTAAREANRDAIEFAQQAGYSGFLRIGAVGSPGDGVKVYDSRHSWQPDARFPDASTEVAGESSGNSGFTSHEGEPAHQAS